MNEFNLLVQTRLKRIEIIGVSNITYQRYQMFVIRNSFLY